jgi:hypothetical protein
VDRPQFVPRASLFTTEPEACQLLPVTPSTCRNGDAPKVAPLPARFQCQISRNVRRGCSWALPPGAPASCRRGAVFASAPQGLSCLHKLAGRKPALPVVLAGYARAAGAYPERQRLPGGAGPGPGFGRSLRLPGVGQAVGLGYCPEIERPDRRAEFHGARTAVHVREIRTS